MEAPLPPDFLRPATWTGFEIAGPAPLLDAAEELLCLALDPADLLGTARETWRDGAYQPPQLGRAAAASADPAPERDGLKIYLAPAADLPACGREILETLDQALPGERDRGTLRVRPLAVPAEDWATLWQDAFRPIPVSEHLLVLPAWWAEEDGLRDAGLDAASTRILRILPGQAFGSGTHATTQLALRLLERTLRPGMRVLDFGAGSGILSFAACALGAAAVVGVEIDPDCLGNFEENARLNASHTAGRPIDYRVGSVDRLGIAETFDLIVCNVLYQRVAEHFATLREHLAPAGWMLYSGYLAVQAEAVRGRWTALGLHGRETAVQEEWGALLCQG